MDIVKYWLRVILRWYVLLFVLILEVGRDMYIVVLFKGCVVSY